MAKGAVNLIHNVSQLSETVERVVLLRALTEGIAAVQPEQALMRAIRQEETGVVVMGEGIEKRVPLASWKRFVVVAMGKCAYRAVAALAHLLPRVPDRAVVMGVGAPDVPLPSWAEVYEGTHPFPTEANERGARALLDALLPLQEDDGVLAVVSGGGTVLLCGPQRCAVERTVTDALFRAGAPIRALNTVRRHLSPLRGGGLARAAAPASVVVLVFSDVPGDDLSTIASGPFVPAPTSVEDAWRVVEHYGVSSLIEHSQLVEGVRDPSVFERVHHILVASNRHALRNMEHVLIQAGWHARVCSTCLQGEARVIGARLAAAIATLPPRAALLYGGETTVTIRGEGHGGRNQEVALGALVAGVPEGCVVASCASDGWDNSPHAGGIADQCTVRHARERNLDPRTYLARNDSANFFAASGDAIITGPTGANVADLLIALRGD